jgi:hypothetical protein
MFGRKSGVTHRKTSHTQILLSPNLRCISSENMCIRIQTLITKPLEDIPMLMLLFATLHEQWPNDRKVKRAHRRSPTVAASYASAIAVPSFPPRKRICARTSQDTA